MKFLVPVDLTRNELQNARIQNLPSAPSNPVEGQIYYDTTLDDLRFYDGANWVNTRSIQDLPLTDLSDVTTTTPSDGQYLVYDSGTSKWVNSNLNINDIVEFNTGLESDGDFLVYDQGTGKWVNLDVDTDNIEEGSNNLYYTDARADGRIAAASISDLSDVEAGLLVDGLFMVYDSGLGQWRFVLPLLSDLGSANSDIGLGGNKITNLGTPTASTDAATKGYVDGVAQGLDVKQSVKALSDSNASALGQTGGYTPGSNDVIDGVSISDGDRVLFIGQSNPSQNGIWVANSASATFVRAEDADTGSDLTAGSFVFVEEGNDYADTGWVLSTDDPITVGTTAQTWVQFSGAGTYTAGTGLTLSGSEFSITPGGVTATEIATGAVDTDELATNAVTTAKITDLNVTTDKLANNSVTTAKIAANAVTSAEIADDAVGTSEISANAVTNSELSANAVQTYNITDNTVTEVKLDTTLANKINVKTDKYSVTIGDNSATSFVLTHNLNTQDVIVNVYETASPYGQVFVDVEHTSANTVTLDFAVKPNTNTYRAVVIG